MKLRNWLSLGLLLFLGVFLMGGARVDRQGSHGQGLNRIFSNGDFMKMNINKISTYIRNNGSFNRDPGTGNAGFEWPKGTGNTANYASGLWLGGIREGTVRVAVAEYEYEYDAGPIAAGVDPQDPRWRMYTIRRGDNASTNADYANWPVADGAPYNDNNHNGVYDAGDTPELIGDMTTWCVFNENDPASHTNMNTAQLGIEVQLTAFAFNRSDALGNNVFYKWKFINKGGANIDSAFVTVWTDIDLGSSGDDYDGCDTAKGIGYTYNDAVDGVYGAACPATGFDFLQGPLVPGAPTDTARYPDGRIVPGKKFLQMTSFIKYNNDATDLGNPNTGSEVYNYQKGFTRTGQAILDNNGTARKFMFPGDPNFPISATNWVESGAAGDRRFLMSAGPFTMASGDTQEVVAANFIAQGSSARNSVTALKNADKAIQTAYDVNFNLPSPPEAPIVTSTALDQEIILLWGNGDAAASKAIEIEATKTYDPIAAAGGAVDSFYNYEGYIVYQVANAFGDNPVMVATYDLPTNPSQIIDEVYDPASGGNVTKLVIDGNNGGVRRQIRLTKDKYTSQKFSNAKDYYFVVTAYSYNGESVPKFLESAKQVITVRPTKLPGTRLGTAYGDTVRTSDIVHSGASDGNVQAFIADPSKITGHNYKITFATLAGNPVWHLDDLTTGERKLSNQINQSGDDAYPMVDGLYIKVLGAANGAKGFLEVANAGGPHAPTQGTFLFNGSGFPTVIECDPGGPTPPGCDRPTLNVGGVYWGIHTGATSTTFDATYTNFVTRVFRGDNFSRFVPYDWEVRFTPTGGKGYLAFTSGAVIDVPFELWRIGIGTPTDPSDDVRVIPLVNDANGNGAFGITPTDHTISGGDNDPQTDWIYWYEPLDMSPGSAGYTAWANNPDPDALLGDEVMARMVFVAYNGGSVSAPTFPNNLIQQIPEQGSVYRIIATKPNFAGADSFQINTANYVPTYNSTAAKADLSLVNAVPNPYFGASSYERNQFGRVVRFTNLPPNAKIRIFSLAGDIIRVIDNTTGTTSVDWDLTNRNDLPVASGIYIVHVQATGIGEKILKVAVIMSEERLDNF